MFEDGNNRQKGNRVFVQKVETIVKIEKCIAKIAQR